MFCPVAIIRAAEQLKRTKACFTARLTSLLVLEMFLPVQEKGVFFVNSVCVCVFLKTVCGYLHTQSTDVSPKDAVAQ